MAATESMSKRLERIARAKARSAAETAALRIKERTKPTSTVARIIPVAKKKQLES